MPDQSNIVRFPPRTDCQSLAERLRQFAEEAERGKIAGCAVAVTWEGERAADPSIGLYRWGTSWALIGASAALTKAMLEDDDA